EFLRRSSFIVHCSSHRDRYWLIILQPIEPPVHAMLFQQLLMRSHFPHLSFVYHQDAVGILNRRESVRNDEIRAIHHKFGKGILNEHFCFRIDTRGGLIKHENRRIVRKRTRKRQQLSLSSRKVRATLP